MNRMRQVVLALSVVAFTMAGPLTSVVPVPQSPVGVADGPDARWPIVIA